MRKRLRTSTAAITAAILLITAAACQGPAGPAGGPGEGFIVELTLNSSGGLVMGTDITAAIEDAVARAADTSGNGSAKDKPLELRVSGLDLDNDFQMGEFYRGIEPFWARLDLSAAAGDKFRYSPLGGRWDKSKILSLTLPSGLSAVSDPVGGFTAFAGFTGMEHLDAPGVTTVGSSAFQGCAALQTVNLPKATDIGDGAFYGCTALETVNLPEATNIGYAAFVLCAALETVNLPLVETIPGEAFRACTALKTVNLPKATVIEAVAFQGCTALQTVNLPEASDIGDAAFYATGSQPLSITLGASPPNLSGYLFYDVDTEKTVTVRRPAAASSDYGLGISGVDNTTDTWANGLRGKGWNGTAVGSGNANQYITVTFADL
jgi:hypothetical protein